jgi:hypothetical protein
MIDVKDVIKNVQDIYVGNNALNILKDFERVLDELDIYVFKNWEQGELVEGPKVNRYTVECTFMWPAEKMPDPEGGARLLEYDVEIKYKKEKLLIPRKIRSPGDFRPGTKKGIIDPHPVWLVHIIMPKKLMQDVYQSTVKKDNDKMADEMQDFGQQQQMAPDTNVQQNAPEQPAPAV